MRRQVIGTLRRQDGTVLPYTAAALAFLVPLAFQLVVAATSLRDVRKEISDAIALSAVAGLGEARLESLLSGTLALDPVAAEQVTRQYLDYNLSYLQGRLAAPHAQVVSALHVSVLAEGGTDPVTGYPWPYPTIHVAGEVPVLVAGQSLELGFHQDASLRTP